MELGVLITGIIGIVTTFASAFISWIFARRKYNSEVDSNDIENLKKSLDFYEEIVKDNNERLNFYINLSETNRREVYKLKGMVHKLLNVSCLDGNCLKRVFFTEEELNEILGEVSSKTEETEEEE